MPETDVASSFDRLEMSLRRYAPPFVDQELYRELWVDEAAA
jgi:hypothetical protein